MASTATKTISPAQQVANAAAALVALAARRPDAGQLNAIRTAAAQPKAMADRHARGTLPGLADDGGPF